MVSDMSENESNKNVLEVVKPDETMVATGETLDIEHFKGAFKKFTESPIFTYALICSEKFLGKVNSADFRASVPDYLFLIESV